MKILIVDDNKDNILFLETVLKKEGYEVISATNGEEALEKLKTTRVDMIISDILMPRMDGFALCRKVKKDENLKDTPFIFYTATYTDDKDEELAFKLGADKFIRKPKEPDELIRVMQEVIKDAKKGKMSPGRPELKEEKDVFKLYSERLVRKLEKKIEELKSSEERLKILFEFAPDAYYISDLKGNFVEGNREAERIIGYNKHELIGKNFLKLKLLTPGQIPKAAVELAKSVMGLPTGPTEFILNRKNGKQIILEIRTHPVTLRGQNVVLGIARDITVRKQAEEQIKASLREKEVLLREIHHRVKNNMQIISSLIRLQSRSIKDKNLSDMFNISQSRIKSMALIHESLYRSRDLASIDFSDYVERLTTHLFSMYRIKAGTIKFNMEIKDIYLDINRAIPCGLIINELVSNCLKHAFLDERKGEITLKMYEDRRNKHTLIVKDNGIGFPKGLDFRNTETLGMQLVGDLVKQLKGKIELKTEEGTEFKILF